MDFLIPLLYCTALGLLFFVTTPLVVLTHELGHAIAYLILTKPDNVDIYIGSYDGENAKKVRIGKLVLHFTFSFPITSHRGSCHSSKFEKNYIKWIIILLAGSLSSLLAAIVFACIVFYYDLHGSSKLFSIAFIGYSIMALILSLFQSSLSNSERQYRNDGENILLALKLKNKLFLLTEINEQVARKNYPDAIASLKIVLKAVPDYIEYHRLLVQVLLWTKEFNKAKSHLEIMAAHFTLTPADYATLGYINSILQNKQLAIENYELCLRYDPTNTDCLNNIGIEFAETGEFEKAEKHLANAIKLQPEFGSAYSMLGYSYILKGDLEQGKQLLNKGLELDAAYGYAYKALGLYYLKANNPQEAQTYLDKAREIDHTINLNFPETKNI